MNVIVLGETGSGKSSLINLILGRNAAQTSSAAIGCTFEATAYTCDSTGNRYFDTAGLNESSKGTVNPADAIKSLILLFKKLESGVNLIIFVVRKGRITEAMVKNYTIFALGVCQAKVPVVLAISGCEGDDEDWFCDNKKFFGDNEMIFDTVVSGCFSNDTSGKKPKMAEMMLESYEETKVKVDSILKSGRYQEAHKFGTWFNWLTTVLGKIWNEIANFFGWRQIPLWETLKRVLMRTLGMGEVEATKLSNEFAHSLAL